MGLIIENDRSPCKQVSKPATNLELTKKILRLFRSLPHLYSAFPNSLLVLPWAFPENLRMQFSFRSPYQ
jgi:hypothetical protein